MEKPILVKPSREAWKYIRKMAAIEKRKPGPMVALILHRLAEVAEQGGK